MRNAPGLVGKSCEETILRREKVLVAEHPASPYRDARMLAWPEVKISTTGRANAQNSSGTSARCPAEPTDALHRANRNVVATFEVVPEDARPEAVDVALPPSRGPFPGCQPPNSAR